MHSVGRTLDRFEAITNSSQFSGEFFGVFVPHGFGCFDDPVIVGSTVLADMLVAIAVEAVDVRRQFRKKSNDVPVFLPAAKHNERDRSSICHFEFPQELSFGGTRGCRKNRQVLRTDHDSSMARHAD